MKASICLAIAASLAACQGERPATRRAIPAVESPGRAAGFADTALSLHDVVTGRVPVGRVVRVAGRCLTMRGVKVVERPAGGDPWWQLEANGAAIVVSGSRPAGCVLSGDSETVTILAIVAEDTLPAIGDLPPAPRRYLVLTGDHTK